MCYSKRYINAVLVEFMASIIRDVGDSLFSILIDKSHDIDSKEQIAIVLYYVHKGQVIKRFVGVKHVIDTTALSLKQAIDNFLFRHGLSISRLRRQGYNRASNMQGEFHGLKTLIMEKKK